MNIRHFGSTSCKYRSTSPNISSTMNIKHSKMAFRCALLLHIVLLGLHVVTSETNVAIDEMQLGTESDVPSKAKETEPTHPTPKLRGYLRGLGSTDFNWNSNSYSSSNSNYNSGNSYNSYNSGNSGSSYNSGNSGNNYNSGNSGNSGSSYSNNSGSSGYSNYSGSSNSYNSRNSSNQGGGGPLHLIGKIFFFMTIVALGLVLIFILLPKLLRKVRSRKDAKVTHYQRYDDQGRKGRKKKSKSRNPPKDGRSKISKQSKQSAPKSTNPEKTFPPSRLTIQDSTDSPRREQRRESRQGKKSQSREKKPQPKVFVGST
jgi:hypothetical protein